MPSKLPTLPRPGKLRAPTKKHRSPIKRSAPSSSNSHVASTEYDPDLGHLTVTFTGGRRYRYSGVSKETAAGLEGAESVGRYLHANVIGKHTHEKL